MTLWLFFWGRCWPHMHSDYGSTFAADPLKAIIGEIQTIWLALRMMGHFAVTVFTVANVLWLSQLQQSPPALARTDFCFQQRHCGPELLKNDHHWDLLLLLKLSLSCLCSLWQGPGNMFRNLKKKIPKQTIIMLADCAGAGETMEKWKCLICMMFSLKLITGWLS